MIEARYIRVLPLEYDRALRLKIGYNGKPLGKLRFHLNVTGGLTSSLFYEVCPS